MALLGYCRFSCRAILPQIPDPHNMDSNNQDIGIMKTTVNIPENELRDAIRYSGAKTKREAVVTAIADFNRRHRMAELVRHAGTCDGLITVEQLQQQRRKR